MVGQGRPQCHDWTRCCGETSGRMLMCGFVGMLVLVCLPEISAFQGGRGIISPMKTSAPTLSGHCRDVLCAQPMVERQKFLRPKHALTAVKMVGESSGGQERTTSWWKDSVTGVASRMVRPLMRLVGIFMMWIRSLLIMRSAWLIQITSQMKLMILDPRRQLDDTPELPTISKEVQAGLDYLKNEKNALQGSVLNSRTDTLFDSLDSKLVKQASHASGVSVESAFRALSVESEVLRASHLEALERLTGVRHTVLDFIESGGVPPSVEALYAWLEYRGIDTSVWGQGEAKTVQEFFHEIWSGESEPLSDMPQRVISVVKVRLTCEDEQGSWALYETKQKLFRDGRTRSRNRPLAEKKRPGEQATEAALRGVHEELGSVLSTDQLKHMVARTDSIEHWEEVLFSKSFPGLETVYKLFMVDVVVPGLHRSATGDTFDSSETPELSTGKAHTWVWKPFGSVERAKDLITVLKARYGELEGSAPSKSKSEAKGEH